MGIKNFKKFLISKIEDPIKKIKFEDLIIKSVCIDINIFIYKFITAIRKSGKDLEKDGRIMSHIIGLKNQINLFEKLNIDMIYVFDGTPPKEKNKILDERKIMKSTAIEEYKKTKSIKSYQQSFFITDKILNDAKEYLRSRNIKYIDIDMEADMICASLVKNKIVDSVYSTDFDLLAFGANNLIINIDYRKKFIECILLKDVLKKLGIKYDDFVEMIVISGCDYCDKLDGMTLNKAYNHIINNDVKLNKCNRKAKEIFMKTIKIKKEWIV
jgi:flap endonuclease-1